MKYGEKEMADHKGRAWDGKDINWYMEHGHTSTLRRPDKFFRPWEGKRLHFYIEMIVEERDKLRKQMEEAKVPFINDWEWDDYQPLPTPVLDPVHEEPAEFDLLAISFKDVQLNFTENLSIPWIADIVWNDPVHMGALINSKTAAARNISDGDVIKITSPYGTIMSVAKSHRRGASGLCGGIQCPDALDRVSFRGKGRRWELQPAAACGPEEHRCQQRPDGVYGQGQDRTVPKETGEPGGCRTNLTQKHIF